MSSKKWVLVFLVTVLVLAALLAGLNLAVDPFGAFGDRLLSWFSYDETNNPRVAKFSYLEQHHDEYDSYILGCSSTSSTLAMESVRSGSLKEISKFSFSGTSMMEPCLLYTSVVQTRI